MLSGSQPIAIQNFRLQTREERLHHCVVEAIPDAAHGSINPQRATAIGEGDCGVLPAMVGVMDKAILGAALRVDGHECVWANAEGSQVSRKLVCSAVQLRVRPGYRRSAVTRARLRGAAVLNPRRVDHRACIGRELRLPVTTSLEGKAIERAKLSEVEELLNETGEDSE